MEFLIHLAKSSILLILFYLFYRLFLRNTTFFKINRAYLLSVLVLSLFLPLSKIQKEIVVQNQTSSAMLTLPEIHPTDTQTALLEPEEMKWSISRILMVCYLTGVTIFLLRFFRKLYALSKLNRRCSRRCRENIAIIPASSPATTGSFSFMGKIFMTESDVELHFDSVYNHEKVHVDQLHSLDILLTELFQILLWFNPIIRLYKQSLHEVHEFLADTSAEDRDSYARFLVAYTMSEDSSAFITNKFYSSHQLKNRIQMLYRKKDSGYKLTRYLAVVPLIFLAVILTASREYIYTTSPVATAADEPIQQKTTPSGGTILPAEITPALRSVTTETLLSDRIVKGKVVESSSESPLVGAVLIIKGTSQGTTTNSDGAFEIALSDGHNELVVSFVGYTSQTIKIGERKNVSIALERSKSQLEELVVVGHPILEKASDASFSNPKTSAESPAIFTEVEQMPEFPGGVNEMYKFLAKNIRYPGEAAKANVQGQVSISFVVNKNGFVRNPKVVKSLGHGTDEEALRVVIMMPRWQPAHQNGTPVDMEYTLPIQFHLESQEAGEKQGSIDLPGNQATNEATAQSPANPTKESKGTEAPQATSTADHNFLRKTEAANPSGNPLFIVDGKEYKSDAILKQIHPSMISSIEVKKDVETKEKYGEKAKHGVLFITTKKADEKK